jgi:putative hydrolase of the HAD superfamily
MNRPVKILFLDLDETLYPPEIGLWPEIGRRINRFMVDQVGIPPENVSRLREKYFQEYGTTLNGLRKHHLVDPKEYLTYVHDLPLEKYLRRDDLLQKNLGDLPQRKWVFSNADRAHIERVLNILGIHDIFDGIIDIYATGFICKPFELAYKTAMEIAAVSYPEECLLVDDQPRNLETAARLGMATVLVRANSASATDFLRLDSIQDLPELLSKHFSW